jgi:sporulation protein YlmC with PRC-barrel domain
LDNKDKSASLFVSVRWLTDRQIKECASLELHILLDLLYLNFVKTFMTPLRTYSTMPQKASSIIGSYVVTPNGESLGDIRDIMVDPRSGMVTYCVVSFGGFMGLGRKLFAVPFKAFNYDLAENEYVLKTNKKHFQTSPGFDANQWPARAEEKWNIFA